MAARGISRQNDSLLQTLSVSVYVYAILLLFLCHFLLNVSNSVSYLTFSFCVFIPVPVLHRCEEDHVWSPYVAEWWNTWSNVPGIALGVMGILHCATPRLHAAAP